METKPIKRDINIVKLSKEHHAGLLFCWKIRQGLKYNVNADRIINYVQHFWKHDLENHFREEEQIVFSCLQDEMVEKAMVDHRQIRNQIHESVNFTEEEAPGKLEKLATLVDEHIRYEERQLFPHLEKKLSALQLETIGRQLSETDPREPAQGFPDEFWVH